MITEIEKQEYTDSFGTYERFQDEMLDLFRNIAGRLDMKEKNWKTFDTIRKNVEISDERYEKFLCEFR